MGGSQPAGLARARFLWLLPVGLWIAIAFLFAERMDGGAPDDFFITYRYARNLALGQGFVFNPGERVFGTTDPGFGLLLGALHFVTRAPLPLIASAVYSVSLVGIATLMLSEGRRRGYGVEAILAGSLLLVSSYFWANQGAAIPLAILLLLLASRLADRSQIGAGWLAGAAVWVRPDAALGVVLLAALVSKGRSVPWRYLAVAAGVILCGVALAWLYFGHPLPNTLGAKGEMAAATPASWSGARFWPRALIFIPRHFGTAWPWVLLAGAAGCWPLARRAGRAGTLLALLGLGIAVVYPLLRVPFFSWYILPSLLAVIYGLAFFAGFAADAIAGRAPASTMRRTAIVICIFLALAFTMIQTSWSFYQGFDATVDVRSYRRAAEWIKANSEPDDAVAYVEIGVLGYYSERPILDLMGLVSPQIRPYVARNDILGAFRSQPTPCVLFHTRGRMAPIVDSRWFKRRYREVVRFEDPGGGGKGLLRVFRQRRPSGSRP